MPRQPVTPPGRGAVRPRYGRLTAAGLAVLVTLVAALGGVGLLPASASQSVGSSGAGSAPRPAARLAAGVPTPVAGPVSIASTKPDANAGVLRERLPVGSGSGRRIVFDMSAQRVWLVDRVGGRDVVRRTYLVSGSVTDNLSAGTYAVYSRSRHAWGVDGSGAMGYMVRFAHGGHAAIGFHDIPVLHRAFVQTRDELGTPQSHGCIRQWRPDAQALWRFAPVGTRVVVTA